MMRTAILIFVSILVLSCSSQSDSSGPKQYSDVRHSVNIFMESIAKDISSKGPIAWPPYFENSPEFFMSDEGQLVFPNYDSATSFTKNTVTKSIDKIELHWSNIRIDSLTNEFVSIGANFHEDINYSTGAKQATDGYFTGIAHQTAKGWVLRNLHWSTPITR